MTVPLFGDTFKGDKLHYLLQCLLATAVGLAIFVMVITNTEHPPAASIALGLVLNGFEPRVILFILLGIVSLSVIKLAHKPILKNLL